MTIVELLVAMSLLTVIVLGLYLMFDRVQRAFRGATTQVDVLEGGRSTVSIMIHDIEQMRGAGYRDATVANSNALFTNIWINDYSNYMTLPVTYLIDGTPVTNGYRDLFFISNTNGGWIAVGYRLATRTNYYTPPTNGLGTLLRFERVMRDPDDLRMTNNVGNNILTNNPFYRFTTFAPEFTNDFQPVLEGVVHLDFRAYDPNGSSIELLPDGTWSFTNYLANLSMPRWVEFEFGMLEPLVAEQARAIPIYQVQTNFLARPENLGKVHLFRQRVAIRQGF
jgi:hypothetical protein